MITLPDDGYTPSNFAALVDASGLTNADFMRRFDIKKATFYLYKNGGITMSWHNWARVYSEVERFITNKE